MRSAALYGSHSSQCSPAPSRHSNKEIWLVLACSGEALNIRYFSQFAVSVSQKNETQQVIQQQQEQQQQQHQQQIIHITLTGHQNNVHYVAYTSYTVHAEYLRNKHIMISENRT